MAISNCVVDGRTHVVDEAFILNKLNILPLKTEVKLKVLNKITWLMADLEISSNDCKAYDSVEDRYTEACIGYIEDSSVEDFLNEEDDTKIWDYLDCYVKE